MDQQKSSNSYEIKFNHIISFDTAVHFEINQKKKNYEKII